MASRVDFEVDSFHWFLHLGHSRSIVVSSVTVIFSLRAIRIIDPVITRSMAVTMKCIGFSPMPRDKSEYSIQRLADSAESGF